MIITKDQESFLDTVAGRSDKESFMQSETAQMYRDLGADAEVAYELDLVPPDDDEAPKEILELDMLNPEHEQGKLFNFVSQTMHDHHWGVGKYQQDGDANLENLRSINPRAYATRLQGRQRAAARTPEEINEFGVEYGGNLNWNLGGGLINWAKVDDLPPDVAIAQAGLLDMYERLPDWTWSGTGRMLKGLGTDPFTYAGGVGGFKVVQQLIKNGGIAAAKSRLMQSAAKAAGFTIIGSEGAAYGVVSDLMMQRLKHNPEDGEFKPNYTQAFIAGGFGAAATAGIAGAPGMYRAGRDAFNRMVGDGATLRSGVGPLPENPMRAGTQLAQQPDEMGFRSGLINMLDALPESASGEQMLATLSKPQRLAEFGAKAEEIGLTGLDKFLRDAEGAITKADIADFLEANRVRLDEARDLESVGYTLGEYDTVTEAYDLDDLISSRETDEYEFSRGHVSGYRNLNGGFVGEPDYVDIMINKYFDIFDAEKNKSVLDEVELNIENNPAYFGNEEAEAAREAAKEIIQQIRNELRGSVGDLPSPIKNRISDLYEDLSANLYGDEVFEAMENRASYDVIDNYDTIGKFDSEDEAIHRANNYIENIDGGDGTGQYSSITFPTESGRPENYKEVRLLMPEDDKRFPQTNVYQHFEQNTFAHYRSTDREVVLDQPDQPDMFGGGGDPKSVMFIEEIQSDLMQAGGRFGYQTEEVMDTWKAEGTEINERLKDKLRAFGYGEVRITDPNEQARDVDILTNLSGLYEGFSRMMKGKDRVEAMQKFIDSKFINEMEGMKINPDTDLREYDPDIHKPYQAADDMIMAAVNSLPVKKVKDEQMYDAFNQFVAALQSLRDGGNEVGGAVRELSPKRYGSKMVDSDGYDRGLEFMDKLTSKDLRDFYRSRDKAIIAQGGVPDIPLKKNWVELTMKRAIYDALEEGKTMIAFPNHAETVGAIEYGGRPATGAIARLYEKKVPKILQKLAKQTGGEIKTGSIAESIKHREYDRFMQGKDTLDDSLYPDQGSVIVLDLSKDPQKVKREGFAIPAIAGGATALTAAQQQEQPQQ